MCLKIIHEIIYHLQKNLNIKSNMFYKSYVIILIYISSNLREICKLNYKIIKKLIKK